MKKRLFTFALAALTIGLLGSCSKINERIDGLDQRVGNIENEKIASIENQIAAINSSIADLGTIRQDILDLQVAVGAKGEDISELKAADEALGKRIDDLQTYVDTELAKYATTEWANATFATLEQLKTTNTELGALKETVGKLGETFDGKLSDLKTELTNAINTAVSNLETRISTLEARVSALEQMIQSVTIVPAYNDGSVESTKDGVLHLDIIVSPAEAVATLTKDCLKVMVNEVKTKAVDVDTVAVTKFKVDAAKGTITARADISSNLPVASGKALTIAVNVRNGISDYTTEFYPVTLSSNVTVKDETDTTKVTIKADADFPEFTMGTIPVASGFTDSKPTTITVEGIGNITFDKEATAKIKSNAQSEGATNVFFKVEDVTTTKPVTNADVVLEVTMKTVDENGIEVFSKGKEAGEVTIQIPMDENVAYVNSVTLVNDAGEPIEGGVVPGSEEIENGILTFKVNHFSKYAVDYVTKTDFVAVTGVSIEPASVTLQVDDTLRLVATIAPEDATNKKVTWSSSDTTKVKVDDTGKITAVAFGKATITVTTKDGNKTADCTVKVSETKTMADILKTTTGIPESQNLTPPANAWVNSTDPDCKAFVGIDAEGDTLFVIKKEGLSNPPAVCMNDEFEKIDDNTYKRTEPDFTFTIKMTEGKFTSLEFNTNIERIKCLNGTYSAPAASIAFDENPFEPGNIKAFQTLTIKGKNLDLVTKVIFCDNVEVTNFKSQSSEQIVIEKFPAKARTGKVTLVNGTTSQEVTSDMDLVVAQPSVSEIYRFTGVTSKQKLTINGENFDLVYDAIIGDDTYLDYTVKNEGHTIEIEMPEEVHDGTVKVIAYSGVEVTVATVTAALTEYTVTFDLNGITGTAPTPQTIEKGGNVTKPADPTYANHTFAGWYKTKDATTGALSDPWDFDNDTVTADMTLYAKWTKSMKDLLGNDFPKSTTNSAPENAWTNEKGYKAFIYGSDKYFKLDSGNANGLSCLTSNQFTRISDGKYVFIYVNGSTSYGVFTLNIEDSTLVSIEYDGAGTTYDAYSGTYSAPVPDNYVIMKMGTGDSEYTLKWSKYNLGATTVAGSYATCAGDYYQWGSVHTLYESIPWNSWSSFDNSLSITEWKSGKEDGYVEANEEYTANNDLPDANDVVMQEIGDGWRMPTSQEFKDLYKACGGTGSYQTSVETLKSANPGKGIYWLSSVQTYIPEYTGTAGILFCDGTNKLFLPVVGVAGLNGDENAKGLQNIGNIGYYLSSTFNTSYPKSCKPMVFSKYSVDPNSSYSRHYGYSIRPVSE